MSNARIRFDYLDGLRGWAALSVVVFHATGETFGPSLPAIKAPYLGLLNDGRFAVAVFFALSGFVLSRRFIATQDRGSLQRMAAGRYVRLALPVGIISTIGFLMAMNGPMAIRTAGDITGSEWLSHAMTFGVPPGVVSFLKFCIFNVFTGWHTPMPYNQFTWTMMYELCGSYLLFATLALFGSGAHLRRFVLIVMCLLSTYFDPLYGLFFSGALLAEANVVLSSHKLADAVPAIVRNGVGLLLVASTWAVSAFARDRYQSGPALALLAATVLSPWLQAVYHTRLSQWLGRISFPLYLVHGYVIFGPGAWMITKLHEQGFDIARTAAIEVPTVIALSLAAGTLLLPVERLSKYAAHLTGRLLVEGFRMPPRIEAALRSIPRRPSLRRV